MLNLTGMLRAPSLHKFEVTMSRCHTANENQNIRKRMAYVTAADEQLAKDEAKRLHPEFYPTSVRKV